MILDRQRRWPKVSSVLFEKYQLCGILGTGQEGTVFLAVHLGLEEYRAIKRVSKSFLGYERFRREALVLKDLRHPGIPIVYDVEEDELYSYLIEEYLEGESLYDLVNKQGHLSRELTIYYGIQLTSIISYLHLAGPNPILHLDLQPKNLLLCQDTLKLIDFGLAASLHDANLPGDRYGTIGCAAPEQYVKDGVLNERTDIYAIGAILHYLYTGNFPTLPYQPALSMDTDLAAVIDRCIKKEKEERFSSAQELVDRLRQLENTGTAKERLQLSSLTIALAGSKSGAGTTHVAVGLSVYLNNHGYPNLYEEKNESGMGAGLGIYTDAKRDQYGLMRYHGFVWKPNYGPGVKLKRPPFKIRILDYGSSLNKVLCESPDALILVCDSRCWNRSSATEAVKKVVKSHITYGIVYNHVGKETRIKLPHGADSSHCLKAPYYPDPFHTNAAKEEFYKTLLDKIVDKKCLKKRSIKEWFAQVVLRKG